MGIDLKDPKWSNIADYLRKLNVDFDRNVKTLIPERAVPNIRPPSRLGTRRGIYLKMIMDDESNTPPLDSKIDPKRQSVPLYRMKGGQMNYHTSKYLLLSAYCSHCHTEFQEHEARFIIGNIPFEQFCSFECADKHFNDSQGEEHSIPLPPQRNGKDPLLRLE